MSLTVQLNTMLVMTAMGIWLGLAIDTYGRFVRNRKWYRWVYIINDCLFWIVQALFVFYMLLLVNEGEMRFYILLALMLGFSAYKALLQNVYERLLEKVIQTAILTYRFTKKLIFVFIVNPTKLLLKLLYSLCMMLISLLLSVLLFLWKCIYIPILWIGRLLSRVFWRFVPKEKLKYLKNKAGFFIKMKNVVRKWFTFKDK
ncbi:spore cortex biosynthesis protein YabQ [Anaerobacillus sp. MEB173]|uniref:spore cortex biosynthesis protein YabQ n=1 Tax=Anaerobacillus sp. MEB173 TaxID=3383345 RepID=UPI003F9044E5